MKANADYAEFDALPDLQESVTADALRELTDAVDARIDRDRVELAIGLRGAAGMSRKEFMRRYGMLKARLATRDALHDIADHLDDPRVDAELESRRIKAEADAKENAEARAQAAAEHARLVELGIRPKPHIHTADRPSGWDGGNGSRVFNVGSNRHRG